MSFIKQSQALLPILGFAFLTACGGGGSSSSDSADATKYNGSTSGAVISSTNSDGFSESSSDIVTMAIESYEAGDTIGVLSVSEPTPSNEWVDAVQEMALSMYQQSQNPQALAINNQTVSGQCGGTATLNGSDTAATITYSSYNTCDGTISGVISMTRSTSGANTSVTIRYNNVTVTDYNSVMTLNGTSTVVYNTNSLVDVSGSSNLTISYNGETRQYSGSYTCDSRGYCTYRENLVSNGEVYQTEDLEVSGNSSTGYDVSATFYDPDYGYVSLEANNVTLCEDGISSGTITLSDNSGNTLVIVYSGCGSDPSMTLNGSSL